MPMDAGMETIAPQVAEALAHAETAATALDEPLTEPSRCKGINKDGSRCKGTKGLNTAGLCSLHSGKVDSSRAAAASAHARRQRAHREQEAREAQQDAVRRSTLAPRQQLALALAERQERAIRALVDAAVPVDEADDVDIPLLLRLWAEAYGKPTEQAAPAVEQPSLDEVLQAWTQAAEAGVQLRAPDA